MSYALRNTLVLAVFLAIIFSVGFYLTRVVQSGQKKKLQTQIVSLDKTIAQRPSVAAELKSSQTKLADMKQRYANRFKVIPQHDTTALTYAYLNRVMAASGFVKFDLIYQGAKNSRQWGYNTYNLRGETSYRELFRFVWYLEHAKLLYKIGDLTVSEHEVKNTENGRTETVLPFTLDLRAYYSSVAGISSEVNGPDRTFYTYVNPGLNFLRPLISTQPPPNVDDLVDVESSELRAVMPDKIFIVDQNGKGHILKVGDRVYLGYLTKIDPTKNEAEFTLNKGGIIDRVDLKVRFGQ